MFTKSGKVRVIGASLLVAAGSLLGLTGSASAIPPDIPSAATARTELAGLTVAPDGSMDGYDRDKFPHWNTVEGSCNTREMVLQRDGEGVEVGSDCAPTSGSWYSPYDGDTWSAPADVDIDHMVPLAAAWRSGASGWSTTQREAFANDLEFCPTDQLPVYAERQVATLVISGFDDGTFGEAQQVTDRKVHHWEV